MPKWFITSKTKRTRKIPTIDAAEAEAVAAATSNELVQTLVPHSSQNSKLKT